MIAALYKGYWSRYRRIDLRDDKFNKRDRENSIFLGVAPQEKKNVIIAFANKVVSQIYSAPFSDAVNKWLR